MIFSIVIVALVGLFFGLILSFASKVFHVDVDSRITEVEEALPSANCGACALCF